MRWLSVVLVLVVVAVAGWTVAAAATFGWTDGGNDRFPVLRTDRHTANGVPIVCVTEGSRIVDGVVVKLDLNGLPRRGDVFRKTCRA